MKVREKIAIENLKPIQYQILNPNLLWNKSSIEKKQFIIIRVNKEKKLTKEKIVNLIII